MKGVKISIITINYNDAKGLERTLVSIANQTCLDFEYIVIDGGSSDDSLAIIEKYKKHIHYYISENDLGIYNAMNKGVKIANGHYLLFLNSGDYLHDDFAIQYLYNGIEGGEDLICFNQQILGDGISYLCQPPLVIRFSDLYFGYLPHASTCIKKELFEKVGLYDENLKIVSDWKFMILSLFIYKCSYKKHEKTISTFILGGISSQIDNSKERMSVINEYFSEYVSDYKELENNRKLLGTNRVKMLFEIEKTTIGKKIISIFFRGYLHLFGNKKLKDIL